MLACASTASLVAKRWMPSRGGPPLDGGLRFIDGQPLLGSSKTVCGLLCFVLEMPQARPSHRIGLRDEPY